MAIQEMIGFEGYPNVLANQVTLTLVGKGLISSANINFNTEVVNGRTRLINPTQVSNLLYSMAQLSTPAELKRVKHWGGFRYQAKVATVTTYALLRFRFAYATSSVSDATALTMAALTTNGNTQLTEVYIEWCLDIPNLLLTVWIDGVKFSETAMNPTVLDTLRDITIYMGQDQSVTNQTWNDFYFVKDTFDVDAGATLSRRLGPVRVRAAAVNSVELPAAWSVVGGGGVTAVAALDSKTLNNAISPVVRTGPDESVAKIGFAKPTPTWDIQALSIREWHFRDTGTTPNLVTQLKQGETLLPPVTNSANISTPRTGSAADKLGVFNRSLDGTPWTADKVDQLEILVNSKTGG
ncbi:hypothetical protein D3C80_50970 [compost metagenome]